MRLPENFVRLVGFEILSAGVWLGLKLTRRLSLSDVLGLFTAVMLFF